eukprot:6213417-Pleurochrysis_carterae.AAC.1
MIFVSSSRVPARQRMRISNEHIRARATYMQQYRSSARRKENAAGTIVYCYVTVLRSARRSAVAAAY